MNDKEQEAWDALEAAQGALARCARRLRVNGLTLKNARYAISSDLDEVDAHIQDVRDKVEGHE